MKVFEIDRQALKILAAVGMIWLLLPLSTAAAALTPTQIADLQAAAAGEDVQAAVAAVAQLARDFPGDAEEIVQLAVLAAPGRAELFASAVADVLPSERAAGVARAAACANTARAAQVAGAVAKVAAGQATEIGQQVTGCAPGHAEAIAEAINTALASLGEPAAFVIVDDTITEIGIFGAGTTTTTVYGQ
jgi:hypothetical protein